MWERSCEIDQPETCQSDVDIHNWFIHYKNILKYTTHTVLSIWSGISGTFPGWFCAMGWFDAGVLSLVQLLCERTNNDNDNNNNNKNNDYNYDKNKTSRPTSCREDQSKQSRRLKAPELRH